MPEQKGPQALFILHVRVSRCRAVLVVQVWPSAVFWPLLMNTDGTFRFIIIDYFYVKLGKDVLEHVANKILLFNTAVAFLLLNGANQLERK